MPRQSLLEYFQPDSRPPREIAVAWRRGYRTIRWTYAELLQSAHQFANVLVSQGITKGDRVLIGGENSGEWLAAFLGCLFAGVVAVPMDAIADPKFAARVAHQAGARSRCQPCTRRRNRERSRHSHRRTRNPACRARTPSDSLFDGNLLANLETLEKEINRYRRWERFFHPLRFLNLLPLSHVFGQLLGIFLPPRFLAALPCSSIRSTPRK